MYRISVLALALLAAPLSAQLTVTATATDFTVGNPNTLAQPGPLVHPTIIDVGTPGPISAYSRLAYEVDDTLYPDTRVVWLSGSSVSTDFFGLGLGNGPTAFQTLDSQITLSAPERMLVDLTVELIHINEGTTPSTTSSTLDIGGLGIVGINAPATTFRVEVDSSGFTIDYDMSNSLPWPANHTSAHSSHLILRLEMSSAAVMTSEGAACGASLQYTADLAGAPTILASDLNVQSGVLAIGSQSMSSPLAGFGLASTCTLDTDLGVTIPIAMPAGQRTFTFVPLPGNWRMQLLTDDGTTARASNVLRFNY